LLIRHCLELRLTPQIHAANHHQLLSSGTAFADSVTFRISCLTALSFSYPSFLFGCEQQNEQVLSSTLLTLHIVSDGVVGMSRTGRRRQADTATGRELVRSTRRWPTRHRASYLRGNDTRTGNTADDARLFSSAYANTGFVQRYLSDPR